jgi:uroporphyrinogen-III synthase
LTPRGPRWAAVGPATAAALEAEGVRVERVPATATGAAISGVLGDLAGARLLLPRARIAGGELPAALAARGAVVDAVAAYDTVVGPERSRAPLADALAAGLDAAVFTSGSTVAGFFRLAADPGAALAEIPAIAIGASTARALEEEGIEPAAVAAAPRPAGIVEALERVAHARA